MFRNVIGVQEAVVHRQSDDSLSHEIKQIKDIQSDDIAQTYSTLKLKWLHKRDELNEYLKTLQIHHTSSSHEIQHIQNLIECLNELIENGEVTKHCQVLINDMNKIIQPFPQTLLLTKKPLKNQLIRLPRHISKHKINLSNSLEKISSQIIHLQQLDETSDSEETTTTNLSSGHMKFYVVAEQFRNHADKKTRKKHYMSPSIME